MDETLSSTVKRPIRRPFFLLHTPDRIGNYLQKETLRIVMGKREKLSAFLAPASLVDTGTDSRGKATQEVSYDLSACQQDAGQMEYLPSAIVTALEQAAAEFCAASPRITDYELKLRQGFRLPDPDIDPQAYAVYGPPENRQLVILWGTEVKQDASLPLVPLPGFQGPTIIDKLRTRIMGASAMRQEALKLLDRSSHPLARFIAAEIIGSDGKVRELGCMGKRIPIGSAKRLRHLPKVEIEAFAQAARQYYEEACTEAGGISAYEKELRAALRVPNLLTSPKSFYRTGKRLLIVCSASDNYEQCVCLTPDSILGLPAPKVDEQGRQIIEPTASEQLEARATPVKLYAAMAGAAAVVVIGMTALGIALLDTTPPAIVQNGRDDAIITTKETGTDQHLDTPQNVRILWTEEVDPASVKIVPGQDATNSFALNDDDGRPVAINGAKLSEDKKTIDLALAEPMRDGKTYKLEVRGIADTSMRRNAIAQLTKNFTFRDSVPPNVAHAGAEGTDSRKLIVTFDEPLNAESAKNRYNYKIEGYTVTEVAYQPDTSSVILTCEKENATGLDKGFVNKGRYTLTIDRGIRDASITGNSHKDPFDVKVVYEDTVPPTIAKIATASQTDVTVIFAEPVKQEGISTDAFKIDVVRDEASATAADAKTADAKASAASEGDIVDIDRASPGPDKYTVSLSTTPLHNGVKYRLRAVGLEDLQGNKTTVDKPALANFFYDGKEDKSPPLVQSSKAIDDTHIELTFGKPVAGRSVVKEAFEVRSDMRDDPVAIVDAQVSPGNPSKVIITLDVKSLPGERVYVTAKNISDRLGNVSAQIKSTQFTLRSNPMITSDLSARGCRMTARDSIDLLFSDNLDAAVASQVRHYYYSGNATVDKVTLDPVNKCRVTLHLSAPEAQPGHTVIASSLVLENDDSTQSQVTFRVMP